MSFNWDMLAEDCSSFPSPPEFSKMEELVDYVDKHLTRPAEYFIAGGSCSDVYRAHEPIQVTDIDLFFESEEKRLDFIDAVGQSYKENMFVTENAITLSTSTPIQAIKIRYGTHQELFDSFDINKSRIGISSGKQIFIDKTFYEPFHIDYQNFKTGTPQRYVKYLNKGFEDTNGAVDQMMTRISDVKKDLEKDYSGDKITRLGIMGKLGVSYGRTLEDNSSPEFEPFMIKLFNTVDGMNPTEPERIKFYQSLYYMNLTFMYGIDLFCLCMLKMNDERVRDTLFEPIPESDIQRKVIAYIGEDNYERMHNKYPEEFI